MPDVYYNPEKFGLRVVAQLDLSEPNYDFDMVVVWEHSESGVLYWAADSGCSCPSPFEKYDSLEDLNLLFSDNYRELERFVANSHSALDRAAFLRSVRDTINDLESRVAYP